MDGKDLTKSLPKTLTLDIAIATHLPEGISRVAKMNLPKIENVKYVISWQNHQDSEIPETLKRDDIEIYRFDLQGQSLNRNNAFSHCSSDIILCSDDDLIYSRDGLLSLIDAFAKHPEVDFATFRSIHHGSKVAFPSQSSQLTLPLPKNYSVACFEIAFRRSTAGWLRCHPKLGLGSKHMHGGEDELLLLTAIRRGLNCRFFPITVCSHPQPSTGTKSTLTSKNLCAMGCIIALTYPWSCVLRVPLKAWRVSRSGQASLAKSLWNLASGALRAPFLFLDRGTMW